MKDSDRNEKCLESDKREPTWQTNGSKKFGRELAGDCWSKTATLRAKRHGKRMNAPKTKNSRDRIIALEGQGGATAVPREDRGTRDKQR